MITLIQAAYIAELAITAGGPGSGCRGPNCGRPPGPGHVAGIGDHGILKEPVKAWNDKTDNNYTYKSGQAVKVIGRMQKIPGTPAMLTVRFKNWGGVAHIPEDKIFVTKAAPQATIVPKAAPKSQTLMKYKSADGLARITIMKPDGGVEKDTVLNQRAHYLKGQFQEVTSQIPNYGNDKSFSQAFFAQKQGDVDALRGTTVFVHKQLGDKKAVTIREVGTGQYGHSNRITYEFRYKNVGAAANFLKRRYGITQALPRAA